MQSEARKPRMNWLRLHHEARTDKKLAALSDAQFRVWFNLLCFSGEQPERGRIGFDDIDVLAIEVAGGDAELLQATIERLVKLKMVDGSDGILAFTNFEKRQYDKPSDTPERVAERVKKHREHQRNADVTPCNTIETETEAKTETENEGLPTGEAPQAAETPSPGEPIKVKAPKPQVTETKEKRRSRLPDDWAPSERQHDALGADGYSGAEIDAETVKFVNYHRHKGDVGLDWPSAFANWMSRSRDWAGPKQTNGPGPPGISQNGRAKGGATSDDFLAYAQRLGDQEHVAQGDR